MSTSVFILLGVAFLLFLHRAIEGMLVSSADQEDEAGRRKFIFEMGTAIFLFLGWAAAIAATLLINEWRTKYMGIVLFSTPFIFVGIAFFSYMSFLVYRQHENLSD
jgi:hypothetical protein